MFREYALVFGSGGLAKELVGYLADGCAEQRQVDRHRGVLGYTSPMTWTYKVLGAVSTEPWDNSAYDWCAIAETLEGIRLDKVDCFLAVAEPAVKRAIVSRFPDVPWKSYIHPSCTISPYARIGRGCVFAPQALVCGDPTIGDFVFFNTNATVGHDTRIGAFTTLYPNTEVCGNCDIGEDCVFGIGAYVLPHVSMVAGAKASAGAVVRKPVLEPVTVYGNPAAPRG